MKKGIISVWLLLCFSPCFAEWVRVYDDFYFDPASIKRTGDISRAWILQDKAGNEAPSIVTLREYNCREEKVRILQKEHYLKNMGAGEPLKITPTQTEWVYINPMYVDHVVFEKACQPRVGRK